MPKRDVALKNIKFSPSVLGQVVGGRYSAMADKKTDRPHLLIIDDEQEIVEILEFLFNDSYNVDTAANGQVATGLLQEKFYHAILSDIKMPVMDGMELLKWVSEHRIVSPFIILTGHSEKEIAVDALRLGAFDFVDKPWERQDLITRVKAAVELGVEFQRWAGFDGEIMKINDVVKSISQDAVSKLLRQDLAREFKKKPA